jgi:phage terminase large subunit
VWVEEAQTVSARSWNILIPTIRADESEIWATFNPELDTDDTYQRFVVHPPENAWIQRVTYRDNPWFPVVLEAERLSLKKSDPAEYEHVWEGKPRTVVVGAIYAGEVTKMIEDRRVRPVPYDPRLLVHTIWDLGWNDQTSIIFAQRLHSEVRVIDYEEESFLRYDQWAKRIKDKEYVYGSHWLPHDGGNKTQAGKGISAQDTLHPLLGMKPKVMPRPATKEVPIRSARMMFPRVYADETKAERLMTCLKRYRRGVPESTGEPGLPVHDEYCHGADAFGGLAMIVDKLTNDTEWSAPKYIPHEPLDRGLGL